MKDWRGQWNWQARCVWSPGTSGIGTEIALMFAARGARVAVAGRNQRNDSLEMLQSAAEAHGDEALYIQADMGNVEGCTRAVAETCALWGESMFLYTP